MSKLIRISIILVILFGLSIPILAMDGEGECTHDGNTVTELLECFKHHIDNGHISDPEVAQGLLDKVIAAQDALKRGKIDTAINNLNAVINLIEAQAGKSIDVNHANHMIGHIEQVIHSLNEKH